MSVKLQPDIPEEAEIEQAFNELATKEIAAAWRQFEDGATERADTWDQLSDEEIRELIEEARR